MVEPRCIYIYIYYGYASWIVYAGYRCATHCDSSLGRATRVLLTSRLHATFQGRVRAITRFQRDESKTRPFIAPPFSPSFIFSFRDLRYARGE